jgi:multiple sugar transport system permease protein
MEWSLLMAAATVITIPMLVLFFFAQRTFIQGIALTGMKG